MGKKRIIAKTQEELLRERENIEAKTRKGVAASHIGKVAKEGIIFISSSYNNTVVTLTDESGNVLAWSSAGSIGFKGTKKSTPFAASKVADVIFQIIKKKGMGKMSVKVKGVGGGRESAIRSFASKGVDITSIEDVTPIPHNGCRPRKRRRV